MKRTTGSTWPMVNWVLRRDIAMCYVSPLFRCQYFPHEFVNFFNQKRRCTGADSFFHAKNILITCGTFNNIVDSIKELDDLKERAMRVKNILYGMDSYHQDLPELNLWSKSSPQFNVSPKFDPSSGFGTFFPSPNSDSGCNTDTEFCSGGDGYGRGTWSDWGSLSYDINKNRAQICQWKARQYIII